MRVVILNGASSSGIVDDVVIDQTHWDDWTSALAGLDVTWVGIRCSADVAEARERSRSDHRVGGLARAQSDVVHRHASYDLEIDTTTQPTKGAVSELLDHLGY